MSCWRVYNVIKGEIYLIYEFTAAKKDPPLVNSQPGYGLRFCIRDATWTCSWWTGVIWDDRPKRLDHFLSLLTEEHKAMALAAAWERRTE